MYVSLLKACIAATLQRIPCAVIVHLLAVDTERLLCPQKNTRLKTPKPKKHSDVKIKRTIAHILPISPPALEGSCEITPPKTTGLMYGRRHVFDWPLGEQTWMICPILCFRIKSAVMVQHYEVGGSPPPPSLLRSFHRGIIRGFYCFFFVHGYYRR